MKFIINSWKNLLNNPKWYELVVLIFLAHVYLIMQLFMCLNFSYTKFEECLTIPNFIAFLVSLLPYVIYILKLLKDHQNRKVN